jgi:hypothetical protein
LKKENKETPTQADENIGEQEKIIIESETDQKIENFPPKSTCEIFNACRICSFAEL